MIYILEDDANIRQMEAYALEHSGYQALELENAAELWQACAKKLPEMLILDLMLPGDEDGMAVLRHLRADNRLNKIPVIIISAKASELDLVKGLDNGADDYLTKPFGIMEFISRVKAILRYCLKRKCGRNTRKEKIQSSAVVFKAAGKAATVRGDKDILPPSRARDRRGRSSPAFPKRRKRRIGNSSGIFSSDHLRRFCTKRETFCIPFRKNASISESSTSCARACDSEK